MSRSRTVTTVIYVERGEEEIELSVEGRFSPGSPGRLWGPPEKCYPDEPAEAEVEHVFLNGQPWTGELTKAEEEAAVEALLAAGGEDDDGPDPDDYYDSRFDDREDY